MALLLNASALTVAHAASVPEIAPFAAHYNAEWKSITVGASDLKLQNDTLPGRYLYTWTTSASGIFHLMYSDDVIQRSWFSIVDEHVRPEKYRAQQGKSTASVDFDWAAGHAHGVIENVPFEAKLEEGTQDIMSIQIEVMLDLRNGNLPKSFRILDKNEVKEFLYTAEGHSRIHTALGDLDTVVVASQRAGNSRVLRMWFAPSLGYAPVQAERSRDGKLEFAMRVKSLTR